MKTKIAFNFDVNGHSRTLFGCLLATLAAPLGR